jgi:hypothetical protein
MSNSPPVLRERPAVRRMVRKAPAVFAVAIFVGAAQLFLLEPMLAKMLLPRFGGAPAVWATCVVFFQALLLAGYAYAHVLTTRLGGRRQVVLHLALLVACFAFFPIGIADRLVPTSADQPAVVLLGILAVSAGLPFFMLASTSPLLQRWFAASGYVDSHDPYSYYAASNAGSLLALLAYPVLVEPFFSLPVQSGIWAVGFGLWFLLLAVCARETWQLDTAGPQDGAWRIEDREWRMDDGQWRIEDRGLMIQGGRAGRRDPRSSMHDLRSSAKEKVGSWTKARWALLAFVPSSLMLGCTSHLSADVASVPLLWIVPLALYLLSFIFAFARATPAWVHRAMILALPLALIGQLATEGTVHLGTMAATHLTTLFVASMVCHGELARSRPPYRWLTEYYLWIAVGGALGSCFNALVAPLLFSWVVEYPLALSLAALLLPALFPGTGRPMLRIANRVVPLGLACVVAALYLSNRHQFLQDGQVVHEERTFFGVYRIVRGSEGNSYALLHGHVWHGMQIDSDDRLLRRLPLLYYSQSSPIGQIFFAFHGPKAKTRTAVIGLGVGSLAGYADSGQEFTFYEIDLAVARIARDTHYFTFLTDAEARGAAVRVVPGDGRLSLQRDHDRRYGMIILDAFSGDAIPAHLLTREAFQLYLDRLEEDGLLALHITNDYLNLEPVVAELAWDQKLVALIQNDTELSLEERRRGQTPSTWVVLARQGQDLGALNQSKRWRPLARAPSHILWRDDYTNLLPILRWDWGSAGPPNRRP